ncbi:MAG: MBOAT family protein [Bacteroidetes bacterium]|jgi:alginate O-acetyltransferase complex protein AlgI|nr:MBOAT family protein [Bacteroidota bacterium]MBT6686700.1 MBOAT family protein [Bacteroidota bacterium]MBT7141838.1 MBOAT family protein [Bacteroidota bacterium]MBT7490671.1 MBOAT family protein [Bacteroidota bacterium]
MLFNSIHFIFFFPIVIIIYFLIPHRYRWIFLLSASYYFYLCFKLEYGFLIAGSTLSSYTTAILISNSKNEIRRKAYLFGNLILNLGILFFFKYFNFTISSASLILDNFNIAHQFPTLKWILPIGISFYTFQVVSYTVDVYWETLKPEKHLGIFALYVSFFPQLVAGPIERASRLIPQFRIAQKYDYNRLKSGLLLMLWGFFQKLVIADRLGIMVDEVFNNVEKYEGLPLILASFGFGFQMYCDFAGYTDIAIGAALVMGFKLMKNFDRPFSAKNISEFWRRWHISLSSWANDYIYRPIAINRRSWGHWGVVYSISATFLFLGIWHGAKMAFILFGAFMGLAFYFEILTKNIRKKLSKKIPDVIYNNLSVVLTFCFFIFTSIFFRGNTTLDVFRIIGKMFTNIELKWYELGVSKFELFSVFIFIIVLEGVHYFQRKHKLREWLASKPFFIRWSVYIVLVFIILNFGEFGEKQFIYFDF